jgi:hypothetical protein
MLVFLEKEMTLVLLMLSFIQLAMHQPSTDNNNNNNINDNKEILVIWASIICCSTVVIWVDFRKLLPLTGNFMQFLST